MDIYLGKPRGFCAGVVRAIEIAEHSIKKFGSPVYIKHQIVHNPHVVTALEKKGAITIENVEKIPKGSTVIFSAPGSPPSDYDKAKKRQLKIIDATCPLVTKVHNEAKKYTKDKRKLILIGHEGHQEVIGTMGHAEVYLIDDRIKWTLPKWPKNQPITIITQTTLSIDDTMKVVRKITDYFSNVIVRNDLCYATTNRQLAVKKLCEKSDMILVIGSPESSNCNRLREVSESHGTPSYLISDADSLQKIKSKISGKIGIISGASTPELIVQQIITSLNANEITEIQVQEENINFTLPKIK